MQDSHISYPIASIKQLRSMNAGENNEPLVDLNKLGSEIICDYRRTDSSDTKILVRETVACKLINVQARLSKHHPHMQLIVVEGYRSPKYQETYFLSQLLIQKEKHPKLEFDALLELTNQFVALPSVAGHPTGGAVDLTIGLNHQEVDMGGSIADFSRPERLPTYSTEVTQEQAQYRQLLHDLMCEEKFAPFYGEWWHFSYRDREWAVFYDKPSSIYSPVYA